MSPSNTARDPHADWRPLCRTADLVAGSGIVALAGGQQVALFYLPDSEPQVFAIGNRDPKSGANVIGRGLVGHGSPEPSSWWHCRRPFGRLAEAAGRPPALGPQH